VNTAPEIKSSNLFNAAGKGPSRCSRKNGRTRNLGRSGWFHRPAAPTGLAGPGRVGGNRVRI
jgi:hypothetical protein